MAGLRRGNCCISRRQGVLSSGQRRLQSGDLVGESRLLVLQVSQLGTESGNSRSFVLLSIYKCNSGISDLFIFGCDRRSVSGQLSLLILDFCLSVG